MVGYPGHGCSSPLAILAVVSVVITEVIVELVVADISFLAIHI